MTINWAELFKIRLSNNTEASMHKHDIIKLLIVRKLLEKHRRERTYIRIYTEFSLDNGRKADVYYENIKTEEAYVYEIQKNASKEWTEKILKDYKDWNIYGFRTSDLIIIKIEELGDSIQELNMQLDKYIF